jgi:NAD(P)-dependent dehydrogenase (short-subunit alcohol dehydrogenase family)
VRPQVALITGGASGIGRALAKALSRRGHTVVIADVDEPAARRTASELGGATTAVALDVTDRQAFRAAAQSVSHEHGHLDLLFNNAGIGVGGLADELTAAHWDRTIDVNLRGVVHGVEAALPIMREQRSGHVVNTASLAGLITAPMMLPYTTTKHAVVALSRALRNEVRDDGIRVTAVCPSFVATPLLDNLNPGLPSTAASRQVQRLSSRTQRYLIDPDDLAEAVLRGVTRNKALVVHPRSAWVAVAAMRLAPPLLEAVTRREIRHYRSIR